MEIKALLLKILILALVNAVVYYFFFERVIKGAPRKLDADERMFFGTRTATSIASVLMIVSPARVIPTGVIASDFNLVSVVQETIPADMNLFNESSLASSNTDSQTQLVLGR